MPYLGDSYNECIFLQPCDPTEILFIINDMKSSKASGPYSIVTKLFVEFSQFLVYPLVSKINMSLKEGIFPNVNKEVDVYPIHKKNEQTRGKVSTHFTFPKYQ